MSSDTQTMSNTRQPRGLAVWSGTILILLGLLFLNGIVPIIAGPVALTAFLRPAPRSSAGR